MGGISVWTWVEARFEPRFEPGLKPGFESYALRLWDSDQPPRSLSSTCLHPCIGP